MDRIGLISTNLAQKIALTVTELPYRVATDVISSTLARALVQEGAGPKNLMTGIQSCSWTDTIIYQEILRQDTQ